MGRPRKKRKYTRRTAVALPRIHLVADVSDARDLVLSVRAKLMTAPVEVRKIAIADLVNDLQWMAQVDEENAPAP